MVELTLYDFDYEINIDDNYLIFKELTYHKDDFEIKLLDKYTIDGKDYIVKEISEDAFSEFYGKEIILPDTIETIKKSAFSFSGITRFTAPPKVKEIPIECFFGCGFLTNVVLHDDIEKIGSSAFGNTKIEEFKMPLNVTTISNSCFMGSNLKHIYLHDNITKIEDAAFYYSDIRRFVVPKKVTTIPNSCFGDCFNLEELILHDEITQIGVNAFKYTKIEKFVCPPKLNYIPTFCFSGCQNLKDVVLHDNIEKIGDCAFEGTKIENFHIPNNINEIGNSCFHFCKNLEKINLNNIKIIKSYAFEDCDKLNVSYQNNKDIYIEDYEQLINKGFVDGQINQVIKGYKNQIYLNDLPTDIPIDILRYICNEFEKSPKTFSNIIKKLENKNLSLNEKLELYNEINNFPNDENLNHEDIEHTI